jgi:hypothetical protein
VSWRRAEEVPTTASLDELAAMSVDGVRVELDPPADGSYRSGRPQRTLRMEVRWLGSLAWSDVWVPLLLSIFTAFAIHLLFQPKGAGLGIAVGALMGIPCLFMSISLVRTLFNRQVITLDDEMLEVRERPFPLKRRVRVPRALVRRLWAVSESRRGNKGGTIRRSYAFVQVEGAKPVLLADPLPDARSATHLARVLRAALELPEKPEVNGGATPAP